MDPTLAMRYAYQPDVLNQLRVKETDTAVVERLIRLENGLADLFDKKVGRSFGVAPVPETRYFEARGAALVLPRGIRQVSSVTVGTVMSSVLVDPGKLLPPTAYELANVNADGVAYAIHRLHGESWWGWVKVTGIWGDQDIAAIPNDVREAATWLTVRQYRRITTNPTEMVGPEGLFVPTPHAWDDPGVADVIAAYRPLRMVI